MKNLNLSLIQLKMQYLKMMKSYLQMQSSWLMLYCYLWLMQMFEHLGYLEYLMSKVKLLPNLRNLWVLPFLSQFLARAFLLVPLWELLLIDRLSIAWLQEAKVIASIGKNDPVNDHLVLKVYKIPMEVDHHRRLISTLHRFLHRCHLQIIQ